MENKVTQSLQNFEKLEPAEQETQHYLLKSDKWKVLKVLEHVYSGIQKYGADNKIVFDYVTLTQILLFLEKAQSDCALEFPPTLHGFRKAKTRKMRFAKILEVDYEEEGIKTKLSQEIKDLEKNLTPEQIILTGQDKKEKKKKNPPEIKNISNSNDKEEEKKETPNQQSTETRKVPILKADEKGNISHAFRSTSWKEPQDHSAQQSKKQKEFQDIPDPVDYYTLVDVTPSSVKIKWKTPSCNNSQITQFQTYLDNELTDVTKTPEIELFKLTANTFYTFHAIAENLNGEGYCTDQKLKFMTLPWTLECLRMNEKKEQLNELKLYVWGSERGTALGLLKEERDSDNYDKNEKCIIRPYRVNAFQETDVIAISGGCKSTVALDAQNQIIQFGETLYSLLQLKKHPDQAQFNIIEIPKTPAGFPHKIRKIAAGQKFFMAVSVKGEVFSWGSNSYSTLGVQSDLQSGVPFSGSLEPKNLSKTGDLMGSFIIDISCSYISCLALADSGKVIAWGTQALVIKQGFQIPSILTVIKPTTLNLIQKVKKISSGRFHHALVTEEGECHTFGSNNYLQLGYETEKSTDLFARKVPGIKEGEWRCVDCICGLDFTFAVIQNGTDTTQNKVLAWGRNKKGQCGVGPEFVQNMIKPYQCQFKQSLKTEDLLESTPRVRKIVAGEKHSLLLDEEGNVWSCGNSKKGQVGHGVAGSIIIPYFTKIENPGEEGDMVRDIGAGEQHSLAIIEGKRI